MELGPRILDAETEHARIVAVLANRAAAIAAAETALALAKANEAAIPEPQAPEPWLELFMALETPPASMRGVSSGEGVITRSATRDRRTGLATTKETRASGRNACSSTYPNSASCWRRSGAPGRRCRPRSGTPTTACP